VPKRAKGIAGKKPPNRDDHGVYRWFAIAAFAVVVVGFARSYYLEAFFGTLALPWLLHLHGALMPTNWGADAIFRIANGSGGSRESKNGRCPVLVDLPWLVRAAARVTTDPAGETAGRAGAAGHGRLLRH